MDESNSDLSSLPSGQASSNRVSCPTCGVPAEAGQHFCGQCGVPLRRNCPACKTDNPPHHRFCSACGAPLEPGSKTAAVTEKNTTDVAPREERRWVTVLLADVSGFTSISESMDPEDVKVLADRCAQRLSEEVRRFGGTVINVIGDEVVAVFGAPVAHEDDAERAVRAGMAMCHCKLSDDPDQRIEVHVGINTGEVMAGLIGPQGRRDYTVMGDVVNTAERLMSAAPSGHLYVGAETHRATQRAVHYRELPPITAKNKRQPVYAWEALEEVSIPQARPLGTAPFIGRDEELNHLLSIWACALRDAQPYLVTILGEPGIGKSRLTAEFERRLAPDTLVLHGRCPAYGEALVYWALAMMLKEAANITGEDEAESARAKLGALVAGIARSEDVDLDEIALHLALLTGLDTEADRVRKAGDQRALHASARRFLEALARHRPLCLILDDIHWADDALLDLIELVASRVRDAPLLIVTQARPELLEKRTTWGRGVRLFTSLPLGPLNESLERDLVLRLCRERGLPDGIADQIQRGPGGNPLFAEEMVAMIAGHGQVAGVPSAIKLLIAARLDTLPPGERNMVQLASVFGKAFWEGGLRVLGAGSTRDIRDLLEALEQKDLFRAVPRSQFRSDREYTFKHDLIRDVAYERLPRAERRTLHARVADWLEQAAGEHVEAYFDQLAHHAVAAGHQERAVDYLMRAAERASLAAADRQAAVLLGQAIAIAKDLGLRALLAELHARRGKALIGVGMWEDARPELEAALAELAPERREQRVQILLDMIGVEFWLSDMVSMRRHATEALQLAEETERDDLAGSAIGALGLAESSDGNLQEAEQFYQRGLARAGKAPMLPYATPHMGLIQYWLGRSADALPRARQAVELVRGNASATMFALPHVGLAFAGAGQYTEAAKAFEEARRFGREYEVWPLLARAIAMSAGFHLDVFDFAGNEALAEEACELARSVGFLLPLVSARIDLLLNFARRQEIGRTDKLVEEVATTVEKAAGNHGWLWKIRLAEARAEIALARGEWEETLSLVEEAIDQSRVRGRVKYHALGLETRARALAALRRRGEAIADLHQAVELARLTDDPAMFLHAATALLDIEGDDSLAHEAYATAQRIRAALPNDAMRHIFEAAEPVQKLARWVG
jgi:class 3 adenylate cyclase/tetratricopeptide (TPR) repeat protein